MARRFVSALDRLREEWDRKAREDPLRHAWPPLEGRGSDEFARSGEALVAARVEPEVAALRARSGGALAALELGCGPGRLLRPMAALFDAVHGVDISAEMVRRAAAWLQGVASVHLHVGDGMTLQCVRKVQFDFALSYDTLAHLPDRSLLVYLVRQVRRRLKRGGLFVFELPSASFDDADVSRLAERAGLLVQKTEREDNELWIRAAVA